MPNYLAHELDPESIHINVNVPFIEHLEDLVQQGVAASRQGKIIIISHAKDAKRDQWQQVELDDDGNEQLVDTLAYRDYEPDFFEKGELQCPQDADAEWERQHDAPRPFPSILIDEHTAQIVIAKPSLCDSCVFNLHRKMTGECAFKRFTSLSEVK